MESKKKKIYLIIIIICLICGTTVIGICVGKNILNENEIKKVGSIVLFHDYNETTRQLTQTGVFTFNSGWAVRSKTWNPRYQRNYHTHYEGDAIIRITPMPYQNDFYTPGKVINVSIKKIEGQFLDKDDIIVETNFPDNRLEFYIDEEEIKWTYWGEDRFVFIITYEDTPHSYVNLDIHLILVDIRSTSEFYRYDWDERSFDIQSFDCFETDDLMLWM